MSLKPVTNETGPPIGTTSRALHPTVVRHGKTSKTTRLIPEEVPVALVFDGGTQAVMMATPADLEDFAIGFAITERIIKRVSEVTRMETVSQPLGIEVRLWLKPDQARQLAKRRRATTGPTGCGLCGIESLEAATLSSPAVTGNQSFTPLDIANAISALGANQDLNAQTHAVHAAGFWTRDAGLVALHEDVGRHNALDKLIGQLSREHVNPADGMIVLTSRISLDLVQKAAVFGASVIVAISAPTGLAVDTANACGLTLVGIARSDGFEIFSHPDRIREQV